MAGFWKNSVTGIALAVLAVMPHVTQAQDQTAVPLDPATMKSVGTIDECYQSYNVEMVEVTGGKFWKPYKEIGKPAAQPSAASGSVAQSGETPAGMSPDLYQYRPPLDLTNRWLRAMAQALAPAYMRISGTWANTIYFADTDTPVGRKNPIWRFRSIKLGDKLFLRPLRGGVDRCINGWQGRMQASLGRGPRWSPRTYAFASSSSSFSVGTLGHG
jgi:hypothetical protein